MKIKKLTARFFLICVVFSLAACTGNPGGDPGDLSVSTTPKTFDLSSGDTQPETVDLSLAGIAAAAETRSDTGHWSATITITVTESDHQGQQIVHITDEDYAQGDSIRVILPRGNKTVEVELSFLENGIEVAWYHGNQVMTADLELEDGASAHLGPIRVEIAMEQVPVTIGVTFMIDICLNIRDSQTSYGIGATAVFKKNGVEIQRVVVGEENPNLPGSGKTTLPMQQAGDPPYTYEIYHSDYETLTGTIQVLSPVEVWVDGMNTYGNLNQALVKTVNP